ncbi:MAG: hypothetical protein ACHQUC_02460 [Chlamydiales bacterium]
MPEPFISSSSSFSSNPNPTLSNYDQVFGALNSHVFKDSKSVVNMSGAQNSEQFEEYIKAGLVYFRESKSLVDWKQSLQQLLRIAETEHDQDLFGRISAICQNNGITSLVPEPNQPETFLSLNDQIPREKCQLLGTNLYQILCFNQGTLPNCGPHSLKNALFALATAMGFKVSKNDNIFEDYLLYEPVKDIVNQVRGPDSKGDAAIIDLRKAWEAILNESALSFPDADKELKWNNNDLSFFNVENNGLVTGPESLDAFVNLKELSQKEGACHHAFVVGGQGHWIALIYEKNRDNQVTWYGIDSMNPPYDSENEYYRTAASIKFNKSITAITEAMQSINKTAVKNYWNSFGQDFENAILKIGTDDQKTLDKGKEDLLIKLKAATQYMKKMGWLNNPNEHPMIPHYIYQINQIKAALDYVKFQGLVDSDFNRQTSPVILSLPIDPFDLELSVLKLHLSNTKEMTSTLTTLINDIPLSHEGKLLLLRTINSYPERERGEQLEIVMSLLNFDKGSLLETIFTPSNGAHCQETWKFLAGLIQLKVIPLNDKGSQKLVQSLLSQVDFSLSMPNLLTRVKDWLSDSEQAEFRTNLILTLNHEIYALSDYEYTRKIANLLRQYLEVFNQNNEQDTIFIELSKAIPGIIRHTSDEQVAQYNSSFLIDRILNEKRAGQLPRGISIENHFVQIPKKQVIYHRKDIPNGLNRENIKNKFDEIEQRMKSDPKVAEAVYRSLNLDEEIDEEREIFSMEKSLKVFNTLKNNSLSDPYMHSITTFPATENQEISATTFHFYSLLNSWLSQSSAVTEESPLSEQEIQFLGGAYTIDKCSTGKGGKITDLFAELTKSVVTAEPSPVRGDKEIDRRNRILTFFAPLLKKYEQQVSNLLHSDDFVRKILSDHCPHCWPNDVLHYKRYMNNSFAKLVDPNSDYSFDIFCYPPNVERDFFLVTDEQFLETFRKSMDPFFSRLPQELHDAKQQLQTALLDNLNIVKARQTKTVQDNPESETNLMFDIQDILEQRIPNSSEIFVYEEIEKEDGNFDYIIKGIKEQAMEVLLEELGIFRAKISDLTVNPKSKIPFETLLLMIHNNKPLRTLNLSDCTHLSGREIEGLVAECGSLHTLNLSGCTQITDTQVNNILSLRPGIESVDLSRCTKLRWLTLQKNMPTLILNGLEKIAFDFKPYTLILNLKDKSTYSLDDIAYEFSKKYHLYTTPILHQLGYDTEKAVHFYTNHPITDLSFDYASSITRYKGNAEEADEWFKELIKKMPQLVYLEIFSDITDDTLKLLSTLEHLKTLIIMNLNNLNNESFKILENCKTLSSIKIYRGFNNTNNITLENIKGLSNISNLTSIELYQCGNLTSEFLEALDKIPNLNSMILTGIENFPKEIGALPKLKSIDLSSCSNVTDDDIKTITEKSPNLKSINLAYRRGTTDNAIHHLITCPLESVNISYCLHFTNDAIQKFAACPGLKSITFEGCSQITDDTARAFTKLSLESINLSGCDKISDDTIRQFAKQINLESINLRGCTQVSDDTLRELAKGSKMKYIYIKPNDNIHPDTIKELLYKYPHLTIT